jgi:primosomal protein N' (replication factor Y)
VSGQTTLDITPDRQTFFADIMLPVPIPRMFTYRVPRDMESLVREGVRVVVPFGNRKIITGIIGKVHDQVPVRYEARMILEILDDHPVMTSVQVKFLKWMASYYMAAIGEVLTAALPSGLKISSESRVQIHPAFDAEEEWSALSDQEYMVLKELQRKDSMTYSEIETLTGLKTIYSLIHGLLLKEAILVFDEVKEKYSPRKERMLKFTPAFVSNMEAAFKEVARAPKQEEALLEILRQFPVHETPGKNEEGIIKKHITAEGVSASALKGLVDKGILSEYDLIISRFTPHAGALQKISLTSEQQHARDQIIQAFEDKDVVLLHGITGSGKTAIYADLIKEVLENGSQVLYLLPEIALTTQIVTRLREVFGDQLGVYHSKFSDNERVEVWKGVLIGRFQVVVGVRSSVFLPFTDLGLVIIDEEHEHSYKQYDPAPRYHARDAAIMLAAMHHGKTLLGTATPSLESRYLALQGKYGYVELKKRYGEAVLPEIRLVDMAREEKKKLSRQSYTSVLYEEVNEALKQNQQVIIFQNRRGYSPYLCCDQCNWIPSCTQCAVSLTYHQFADSLVCHYCGHKEPVPSTCEACGNTHMKPVGLGTERIEEETSLLFEGASILRMDLDSTRSKYGYEKILQAFEQGEANILVGTQMVSKGLDFDGVSLVGIVDFDRMLHFPNFRSTEKAFQMALQVSGRAGRKNTPGKVVIQTRDTSHSILKYVLKHDYEGFYDQEIEERKVHGYPPFTRIVQIHLKHRDRDKVRLAGVKITNLLRSGLGAERVLGPQEPVINKVRNEFLIDILVKLERSGIDLNKAKASMTELAQEIQQEKDFKQLKIVFDVDPY